MHDTFRTLLNNSEDDSRSVVAANLDIRAFSDWSLTVESAQTAEFLKKVYIKLIDEYFPEPAFVTPTGDGLLVVVPFKEPELVATVRSMIDSSFEIVNNFPSICDGEAMINFDTPPNIGIGIARGTATCLLADGQPMDYTGRVLNLATRLMDLARPRGVVLDGRLGMELLTPSTRQQFVEKSVFLKGVSPNSPMEVHVWPSSIEIPEANLHPIGEEIWDTKIQDETLKSMSEQAVPKFRVYLPVRPVGRKAGIDLVARHPALTNSGRKSSKTTAIAVEFTFHEVAGEAFIIYDQGKLVEALKESGVKPSWEVKLVTRYRVN